MGRFHHHGQTIRLLVTRHTIRRDNLWSDGVHLSEFGDALMLRLFGQHLKLIWR